MHGIWNVLFFAQDAVDQTDQYDVFEDVAWVEFMYLAYARLPGNSCHGQYRSLLCSCDVFPALFRSLC